MLGVSAVPGLSDLLAGRVSLARAVQRTPRIPSLRVITTGGAATAAGLMQSQRLKDTLEALRRQGGYVVIEAPSTSSSADAQSLASLADAAILAVELRRSRRPALLDAAEQLQRVGTPLLGAVVLPRLSGLRSGEVNQPAVTLPPPGSLPVAGRKPGEPVLDDDMTQPMRFPTGTVSAAEAAARKAAEGKQQGARKAEPHPRTAEPPSPGDKAAKNAKATQAAQAAQNAAAAAVRQRATDDADEITAVIDLSGAVKAGNTDTAKDGDGK
jgi:hypothetical protein